MWWPWIVGVVRTADLGSRVAAWNLATSESYVPVPGDCSLLSPTDDWSDTYPIRQDMARAFAIQRNAEYWESQ